MGKKFASRKFGVVVFVNLVSVILVYLGKIDGSVFQSLMIFVNSAYFATNAYQNVNTPAPVDIPLPGNYTGS
jgi:hypothetical protein